VKPVHCNESRLKRKKRVGGGGRGVFEWTDLDTVPIMLFEGAKLKG